MTAVIDNDLKRECHIVLASDKHYRTNILHFVEKEHFHLSDLF